jgi:hypothetical protein
MKNSVTVFESFLYRNDKIKEEFLLLDEGSIICRASVLPIVVDISFERSMSPPSHHFTSFSSVLLYL